MKLFKAARKYGSKIAVAGSALVAAGAQAADQTALITAAQADAAGNQGAVIAAVIAVAVIGFGAAALLHWLHK